jgi:aminoglycoside phosphotransferase (APT) family kinase protein
VLAEIHQVAIADLAFLPERTLTDVPLRRRNPPVLLHGHLWPGNVLWQDGRLVAVLDWEDAAIGDPLADVANARLELLWARGAEAKDEFTRWYRSLVPGVDVTDLPHWDRWAGLRLAGFEPAKR